MTDNETTNTTTVQTNLAISDIASLLQIVEVVSQRGAFRAEELSSVGALYDKVKGFIVANTPATEQPTEEVDQ
jgi:hypothetical protein